MPALGSVPFAAVSHSTHLDASGDTCSFFPAGIFLAFTPFSPEHSLGPSVSLSPPAPPLCATARLIFLKIIEIMSLCLKLSRTSYQMPPMPRTLWGLPCLLPLSHFLQWHPASMTTASILPTSNLCSGWSPKISSSPCSPVRSELTYSK